MQLTEQTFMLAKPLNLALIFFSIMSNKKTPTLASLRADEPKLKPGEKPAAENPAKPTGEEPKEPETPEPETPETPEPATPETPETAASAPKAPTIPSAAVEMVSISATELGTLRAAQKELSIMKPQFEMLDKWHKNMNAAGATGGQDASDATPNKKKVSRATQKAIDMKNSQKA